MKKTFGIGILLCFLCIGSGWSQILHTHKRTDSIKSEQFKTYAVKVMGSEIVKKKRKRRYMGPIRYDSVIRFYNKEGLLVEERAHDRSSATLFFYANDTYKKIATYYYLKKNPKVVKDSIVYHFHFDRKGNLVNVIQEGNEKKFFINYWYYLVGNEVRPWECFFNYYILGDPSNAEASFHSKTSSDSIMVLYDEGNKRIATKKVTIKKGSPSIDSILDTKRYEYNDKGKLLQETRVKEVWRKSPLQKNFVYVSRDTIRWRYVLDTLYTRDDQGRILEKHLKTEQGKKLIEAFKYDATGKKTKSTYFNHFSFPNQDTKQVFVYNKFGDIISYEYIKGDKIKAKETYQYSYNNRGDWIKRIHYDKKGRPVLWVDRILEYHE